MKSKKPKFHRYHKRDQIVRSLGYPTYRDYLQSELWRSIRRRVLGRDACHCGVCMRQGFYVHHLRYDIETLTGESLDKMVTICKRCHEQIEFDSQGQKNTLGEANTALDKARLKTRAVKKPCTRCKRPVLGYSQCGACRSRQDLDRPPRAMSLLDYIESKRPR